MALFLDTSAILKLYHLEEYSSELSAFLNARQTEALIISELALVEFDASVWRKVKSKQPDAVFFDERTAVYTIKNFENDLDSYQILLFQEVETAGVKRILNRVNARGGRLRSLDAIQLFCATKVRAILEGIITFDTDLAEAAQSESLKVFDRTFFSAAGQIP